MKVLRDLRRTILAATTDADRHEIRQYVLEHAAILATAFGVTPDAIAHGLEKEEDDAALARRLLTEIKKAAALGRQHRVEHRASSAQTSADVLAGVVPLIAES